jgi:hypothetical protein
MSLEDLDRGLPILKTGHEREGELIENLVCWVRDSVGSDKLSIGIIAYRGPAKLRRNR